MTTPSTRFSTSPCSPYSHQQPRQPIRQAWIRYRHTAASRHCRIPPDLDQSCGPAGDFNSRADESRRNEHDDIFNHDYDDVFVVFFSAISPLNSAVNLRFLQNRQCFEFFGSRLAYFLEARRFNGSSLAEKAQRPTSRQHRLAAKGKTSNATKLMGTGHYSDPGQIN